jgi:alpha-glucosidase
VDPYIYTRWIQFGVFSPILRTHTTKNPGAERRTWAYPLEFADAMRQALLLRSSLIPYIYTASRETYDSGVPFLRPLYFDWPESPEAYLNRDEYLFGDSLLVAPIVGPRSPATGLATRSIWLPAGSWIEWSTGRALEGPRTIERAFAIDEVPVYVKGGSIVPRQHPVERAGAHPAADPLVLDVFPAGSFTTRQYEEKRSAATPDPDETGSATTRVYEDQGDSTAYQSGEGAWTTVRVTRERGVRTVRIDPVEGRYPGMREARGFEIRLRGLAPPRRALVNGQPAAFVTEADRDRRALAGLPPEKAAWWYDGGAATIVVAVPPAPVSAATEIRVEVETGERTGQAAARAAWPGFAGTMRRLHDLLAVVNGAWPDMAPPDLLLNLAQMGNRLSIDPAAARAEVDQLGSKLAALKVVLDTLPLKAEARVKADALMKELGY